MNNRRQATRVTRRLPLVVEGLAAQLVDISSTGARVCVAEPLFIGGCVELQVSDTFCLRGRAVWQRGDQAGVAFHDLDQDEEMQLAQLLSATIPWRLILGLLLVSGLVAFNFTINQLMYYYTLWQVSYGS